jgi:hypothetical protein
LCILFSTLTKRYNSDKDRNQNQHQTLHNFPYLIDWDKINLYTGPNPE